MNTAMSRRSLPLLLLLILACWTDAVYAQGRPGGAMPGRYQQTPTGQLNGTVLDADTGDPIMTATVSVWNAADSTLATGAVSDADGTPGSTMHLDDVVLEPLP